MTDETVTVSVNADTSAFDRALSDLEKRSSSFGNSLNSALKGAITSGKGLEDVLRGLASSLAGTALSAGLQPLQGLTSSMMGGLLSGIRGIMPFAKGEWFQALPISAWATARWGLPVKRAPRPFCRLRAEATGVLALPPAAAANRCRSCST